MKTLHDLKLKWWQLALLTVAVSLLGRLSGGRKVNQRMYTQKLKQAPWAPPGWLFGPAWTGINYCLLRALKEILQHEPSSRKKKLLMLQVGIWFIFFSFNYVYFHKKSPLLASVWTVSDAALAAASFAVSQKAHKSTSVQFLPLLTWTTFASSLAVYQALKNPDPLFKTSALFP